VIKSLPRSSFPSKICACFASLSSFTSRYLTVLSLSTRNSYSALDVLTPVMWPLNHVCDSPALRHHVMLSTSSTPITWLRSRDSDHVTPITWLRSRDSDHVTPITWPTRPTFCYIFYILNMLDPAPYHLVVLCFRPHLLISAHDLVLTSELRLSCFPKLSSNNPRLHISYFLPCMIFSSNIESSNLIRSSTLLQSFDIFATPPTPTPTPTPAHLHLWSSKPWSSSQLRPDSVLTQLRSTLKY
jgi:hypothetical protein